jgi:hypothetical protein
MEVAMMNAPQVTRNGQAHDDDEHDWPKENPPGLERALLATWEAMGKCCGSPLVCYQGEPYCPDCTRYEAEQLARQTDDEARALRRALDQAPPPEDGTADDGPPF